jgi:hypothetical protein
MMETAALEAPPYPSYCCISHQSALIYVIQRKHMSLVYIFMSDILAIDGAVNRLETGLSIGSRFLVPLADTNPTYRESSSKFPPSG